MRTQLDAMLEAAGTKWNIKSNGPGLILSCLTAAGITMAIVYHFLLIDWNLLEKAWLLMECITLGMSGIASFCILILLWLTNTNEERLKKSIQFESIVFCISFSGFLGFNVSYIVANFKLGDYLNYWAASASILQSLEGGLQTVLLMAALRHYAKFLNTQEFRLHQSVLIYLLMHNFLLGALGLIRQDERIYGQIFASVYGKWIWTLIRFGLTCTVVLFRWFSAVCCSVLWSRTFLNN